MEPLCSLAVRPSSDCEKERSMLKGGLLWLIGIPIPIIILLMIFVF